MKQVLSAIIIAIALVTFLTPAPVLAADVTNGAKVFTTNCAACHQGGGNIVNQAKTLKKRVPIPASQAGMEVVAFDVLEKYEMASLEAIKSQVINGKNAMPSFKKRLSEQQIEDVAAYVLAQAEKGW